VSCGVGRRQSLDPTLLWLWRRPVATALIRPLAREPAYAVGAALKRQKKKKINSGGGRVKIDSGIFFKENPIITF